MRIQKMLDDINKYKLSSENHKKILANLELDVFDGIEPSEHPIIYISGGQPASGKGRLISIAERELKGNAAIINGDEYRFAHPKIVEIFQKHERELAQYTDYDVRRWTQELFEKAISEKYNIIFEGTMRTNQICRTIEALKNKNYTVNINIMAVNECESRLNIYKRYEMQLNSHGIARFTSQESHDAAYTGMRVTLKEIEDKKLYSKLAVYDRNIKNIFLSNSKLPRYGVVSALEKERGKIWDIERYIQYKLDADKLILTMNRRKENMVYINDIQSLMGKAFNNTIDQEKIDGIIYCNDKGKTINDRYKISARDLLIKNNNHWNFKNDEKIISDLINQGFSKSNVEKTVLKNSPIIMSKEYLSEKFKTVTIHNELEL